MTVVRVQLEKYLDSYGGATHEAGDVVARVRRLTDGAAAASEDVLIPAGGPRFRELELEQGRYAIEALLPSSELVSRTVEVGDEPLDVFLRGDYSPREWLSWHHLGGAIAQERKAFDAETAHQDAAEARDVFVLASPIGDDGADPVGSAVMDILRAGARHRPPERATFSIDATLLPALTWHREGAYSGHIFPATPQFDGHRRYVMVEQAGRIRLLGVLPDPWQRVAGSVEPVEHDVLVAPAHRPLVESSQAADLICSTTVRDPLMATTLGYLGAGALPAAAAVLRQASEMLFDKVSNPVAAAAGGYILLASWREVPARDDRPDWLPWLANLTDWIPWLPDGAIQHGWRSLHDAQTPTEVADARELLLTGHRRGLPFYSAGVRLLVDGLTLLSHEAHETGGEDPEVQQALSSAQALALHTDLRSPFTVIRLPT